MLELYGGGKKKEKTEASDEGSSSNQSSPMTSSSPPAKKRVSHVQRYLRVLYDVTKTFILVYKSNDLFCFFPSETYKHIIRHQIPDISVR